MFTVYHYTIYEYSVHYVRKYNNMPHIFTVYIPDLQNNQAFGTDIASLFNNSKSNYPKYRSWYMDELQLKTNEISRKPQNRTYKEKTSEKDYK